MHVSPRSHLTAGIAVLGAGILALAPVQAPHQPATALPQRAAADLGAAVLLSSFDPITPWVDTITTSVDNIVSLIGYAFSDPFPIGSAVVSNPGLALSNFTKLFTAPFSPGETGFFEVGTATPTPSEVVYLTVDNSHLSDTTLGDADALNTYGLNLLALQLIVSVAPNPPCEDQGICNDTFPILPISAVLTAINTYASGVVLGLLGPVLAPVAAVINSVTAIIDFLGEGDFSGAGSELVNIPANLVNGFLNGATLNVTPIVNLFAPGVVDFVGLNLGGLLAGPVPMNGSLVDPADAPTEFSGGTLFTSLAVAGYVGVNVDTPGLPSSPIGSLIGMGQFLGQQLLTPPETPAPAADTGFRRPARPRTAAVVQAPATETKAAVLAATDLKDAAAAEDPPAADAAPDTATAAEDAAVTAGAGDPRAANPETAEDTPAADAAPDTATAAEDAAVTAGAGDPRAANPETATPQARTNRARAHRDLTATSPARADRDDAGPTSPSRGTAQRTAR